MTGLSVRPIEWVFVVLATAFVAGLPFLPYPGDVVLKVAPIICLLVAVALTGTDRRRRIVLAALVFCGIGDISLERGLFTLGLGAFLVGHLFYLSVFCRRLELNLKKGLLLALLLLYGAGLINYLAPHLGDMRNPVVLYMGVIFAMSAAAISGRDNHALVALGAVLFVLSDSLIAINRFVEPVPGARYWIMTLYYGAQFFLTWDARHRDAAELNSS